MLIPTIQTYVKIFCFAKLHLASFTKNHYQTWQFCYCLGSLFSVVTGFSLTGLCHKLRKTVERSVSEVREEISRCKIGIREITLMHYLTFTWTVVSL